MQQVRRRESGERGEVEHDVHERVERRAEHRGLVPAACDPAVEHVVSAANRYTPNAHAKWRSTRNTAMPGTRVTRASVSMSGRLSPESRCPVLSGDVPRTATRT
jgi:hypothetical protein